MEPGLTIRLVRIECAPVRRVEISEGGVDVSLEGVGGRLDDQVVHPRDEVGGQGDQESLDGDSRRVCPRFS